MCLLDCLVGAMCAKVCTGLREMGVSREVLVGDLLYVQYPSSMQIGTWSRSHNDVMDRLTPLGMDSRLYLQIQATRAPVPSGRTITKKLSPTGATGPCTMQLSMASL